MRSFICMWMGELAMKVCTRPEWAPLSASPARRMSFSLARASAQIVLSLIAFAIARTASKSPLDEAGNPASITSAFRRSSCLAMRIFSSRVIDAPGLCSPSRRVVSKTIKWSGMISSYKLGLLQFLPAALLRAGSHNQGVGSIICARGAAADRRDRRSEGDARKDCFRVGYSWKKL